MSKEMTPKVRRLVIELLTNRWAVGCFTTMAVQKLVEASATYWLVQLTIQVTTGGDFLPSLFIYLGSLLFPYIPECIAEIFLTSWKQDAQRTFVNTFVSANRNNITEWGNKNLKEEKLSILTSEGPNALHLFIDYLWDLYSNVLSALFNILALSLIVEPLFAVSYGLSVFCVMGIMGIKRRSQRRFTQKALIARIDLVQSLLAAWDNVLLGNQYNFKLWNERTSQRLKRCLRRNMDLERFDQILAICVSLITSIPSLIVVVYSMRSNWGDVVRLSSFVVVLPMLFWILSYTYETLSLVFRWGIHRSKLITIYKGIEPISENPAKLEKKIKWPRIIATYSTKAPKEHISLTMPRPIISNEDLVSHTSRAGRLTLRGENGSGKSTALMLTKNALGNRAFFLPTHSQLSFAVEVNKYSTGESLRNRLLEILDKVDVDVLLLDEWDANLDQENQEKLTALIDQLAQKKCVIEVRHR